MKHIRILSVPNEMNKKIIYYQEQCRKSIM